MSLPASEIIPITQIYKKIRLRPQNKKIAEEIATELKVNHVVARVLAARGFVPGALLNNYLDPTLKDGLSDPSKLKDLDKACAIVAKAVKDKQKIAICCDFDVDGLSAGSLVLDFLKKLGAEVMAFVPDRFIDGYGLNSTTVDKISAGGFSVMLAIDFGTTNQQEILLARKLGIQTIVIDHHFVGEHTPNADAFINPQQIDCGFSEGLLCAAGLAWFFLLGLKQHFKNDKKLPDIRSYLDLACLGTICDMVPLLGANRVLARRGLEQLNRTQRVGLLSLKAAMGVKGEIACSDVSFGIGPRLNAAGRMVHGELVIELLSTNDPDKANKLAQKLNKLNTERQEVEMMVKERAIRAIAKTGSLPHGICVASQDFHTGVVGIVAQRLAEMYQRPSMVLGKDSTGVLKGSVRGVKGFNVVEALTAIAPLLLKFGGHSGAGGLSVSEEKLPLLEETWNEECRQRLSKLESDLFVDADTEITLDEMSLKLVEEVKRLQPFGMGNPHPLVMTSGLNVKDVRDIKGMHLKVLLGDNKQRYISGFLWRTTRHPALAVGANIKIAYRPESNRFNGATELLANIQAVERE